MSEIENNLGAIRGHCKKMTLGAGNFFRADMDELALRVEKASESLPERFVELVENTDTDFPAVSAKQLNEIGNRLLRILSLMSELDLVTESFDDEELLPKFSLDSKERAHVLDLCAQMREFVFSSKTFDNAHKRRLSNRISAIERQVHQPKGLFDVILGGISDVGEVLGKFGSDVKPLTDRMAEIAKITREGTKEYESLPAPQEQKRLPPPEE